MKKPVKVILCFAFILACLLSLFQEKTTEAAGYTSVTQYDPKRDAEKDISDAIAEAKRTGKNVLLEVGGEWCTWCRTMDAFYAKNPELKKTKAANFVSVKIAIGPENPNPKALSRYPKAHCTPQLIVLDRNGKLLHSQDTCELEAGKDYDLAKFTAFLKKWAPSS